jgi:outer membrane immunogenic protein
MSVKRRGIRKVVMRMLIAGVLALGVGAQAFAADLPGPPPAVAYLPTVASAYDWGGLYVGANGGYGFGSSNWTDPGNPAALSTGDFRTSGFLLGGTLGANMQVGALVFGFEADIDWSTIKGSVAPASGFCALPISLTAAAANCETKNDWLGTGRARIGFAADRLLFFATAGAAFGSLEAGVTGAGVAGLSPAPGTFQNSTVVGWTAGAGVEFAFAQNWTAKVEYLFVDLGNASCNTVSSCGFDVISVTGATHNIQASDTVKFSTNLVRFGLNYKFGPW